MNQALQEHIICVCCLSALYRLLIIFSSPISRSNFCALVFLVVLYLCVLFKCVVQITHVPSSLFIDQLALPICVKKKEPDTSIQMRFWQHWFGMICGLPRKTPFRGAEIQGCGVDLEIICLVSWNWRLQHLFGNCLSAHSRKTLHGYWNSEMQHCFETIRWINRGKCDRSA